MERRRARWQPAHRSAKPPEKQRRTHRSLAPCFSSRSSASSKTWLCIAVSSRRRVSTDRCSSVNVPDSSSLTTDSQRWRQSDSCASILWILSLRVADSKAPLQLMHAEHECLPGLCSGCLKSFREMSIDFAKAMKDGFFFDPSNQNCRRDFGLMKSPLSSRSLSTAIPKMP
jgi:hypothetical protein